MPERLCCAECFSDDFLRDFISEKLTPSAGECGYCHLASATLMDPVLLRESFENVLAIYVPDSDGRSLPALLRRDWGLFAGPVMGEDPAAKELLADILDDGEIIRKPHSVSERYKATSLADWDELRHEMMHGNRWFLDQKIDYDRLQALLDYLIVDPTALSSSWHRARIVSDDPFPLEKTGAPPPQESRTRAGQPRGHSVSVPWVQPDHSGG